MGMGRPPQGEVVSPSYQWHQTNERGIPHTTGIHRIVVDQKKGKKGEKKRFNLFHLKKGEIGGLTKKLHLFLLGRNAKSHA
jgi:hypothetical protein